MAGTGLNASWSGPLTKVDRTAMEEIGAVRLEDNKWYKYLRLRVGGTTLSRGDVVGYTPTGDVDSDRTDTIGLGAGVAEATMTAGQYGWFQIKGRRTLRAAAQIVGGANGTAYTFDNAGDSGLVPANASSDGVVAFGLDVSAGIIMCDFPW